MNIKKIGLVCCSNGLTIKELPIATTKDIGHGTDSKAIVIGRKYILI